MSIYCMDAGLDTVSRGGQQMAIGRCLCVGVCLSVLLLCSCNRRGGDPVAPVGGVGGEGSEGSGRQSADISTPIIMLSKGPGGFEYRVHGERKTREELSALMLQLSSFSADIPVVIVRDASISYDEVNLVAARIREKGLRNIRIEQH